MHHVAIMKKSWGLIPKILSGEKTIESRWYLTRRAPWDAVRAGDTVFFKNAGEPVSAKAAVARVLQFELSSVRDAERIVRRYGKGICLVEKDPRRWERLPRYCILVFLRQPKQVAPFAIRKDGFGIGNAWLTVPAITSITLMP